MLCVERRWEQEQETKEHQHQREKEEVEEMPHGRALQTLEDPHKWMYPKDLWRSHMGEHFPKGLQLMEKPCQSRAKHKKERSVN